MDTVDIAHQRLHNQSLLGPKLPTPQDFVSNLVAVQAQDYAASKWAVAQRTDSTTDAEMDAAVASGDLIRTHVMRPTWHFVSPTDIRWLLTLTAPRVHAISAYYYRQLELDDELFARSDAVLAETVAGGKQLIRAELSAALEQAGIIMTAVPLRLPFLLLHAELAQVICSGGRRGKQFTYASFDERVPPTRPRTNDEALAELAQRFFSAHGPATLKDFVWWSGLRAADARAGLEMAKPSLGHDVLNGKTFWFDPTLPSVRPAPSGALLIPAFDEYFIAYHDRDAVRLDPTRRPEASLIYGPTLLVDGEITGTWRRTIAKSGVTLDLNLFSPLDPTHLAAVETTAERYSHFLNAPLTLLTSQAPRA